MRRLAAALVLALAACTPGGAPAPTAAPSPSGDPSVPPATGEVLVYVADRDVFRLDPRTQRPVRIASVRDAATGLAVSADGRYAAVAARGAREFTLTVVDVGTGRARPWAARRFGAREVGATGAGFVVVDEVTPATMWRFEPAAFLAGQEPAAAELSSDTGDLLTTSASRILVTTGAHFSGEGDRDTVYEVTPDGSVLRLFTNGEGLPGAEPRNRPIHRAAITADGSRLVYGTGGSVEPCRRSETVVVLDLKSVREVPTTVPTVAPDVTTAVGTVTSGPDGRTVVGFSSRLAGCGPPYRGGAYALEGTAWRLVAPNATWAATSRGGHLAAILADGSLKLDDTLIAPGVAFAAWAVV